MPQLRVPCLVVLLAGAAFGQAILDGEWQLKPLVTVGMKLAGEAGEFREVGRTHALPGGVLFWGQFGTPDAEEWGLFSFRKADGKISRIGIEAKPILLPGGRKVRIDRDSKVRIAGNRLYLAPDLVWDGAELRSLASEGEAVPIGGTTYRIKRVEVLDVAPDGRALVYWDSEKPPANGWAWHDGVSFHAWLKEGEPLPGHRDLTIQNLSAGDHCFLRCVPLPKIGADGTVAAVFEITGPSYKKALYRVGATNATKVADDSEQVTDFPTPGANHKVVLGDVLAVNSKTILFRSVETSGAYTVQGWRQNAKIWYVLAQREGMRTMPLALREQSLMQGWDNTVSGPCLLPDEESDHMLLTFRVMRAQRTMRAHFKTFFPGLYEWNGSALNAIAWETALGADPARVMATLERKGRSAFLGSGLFGEPSIDVAPAVGEKGAVRVRLPAVGAAPRNWLIATGARPVKLERGRTLGAQGAEVTAADIAAWFGAEEALVERNDGVYLMTRPAR